MFENVFQSFQSFNSNHHQINPSKTNQSSNQNQNLKQESMGDSNLLDNQNNLSDLILPFSKSKKSKSLVNNHQIKIISNSSNNNQNLNNSSISSNSFNQINQNLKSNLKIEMLNQLLCSQALIDSNSFKILNLHQIDQIKSNNSKLQDQLNNTTQKLNLQLKLEKANNLLIKLNDHQKFIQDSNSHNQFYQLQSQKEFIQNQIHLNHQKLLKHFSAIIGLGYKKLENQLSSNSSTHSTLFHHQHQHHHHHHLHHSLSIHSNFHSNSHPSSFIPNSNSNLSPAKIFPLGNFDGPHLFANNQLNQKKLISNNSLNNQKSSIDTGQLNSSKDEILSLKNLLNSRDALIAEQASDLNLLELELETLKHSTSQLPSNHHLQLEKSQKEIIELSNVNHDLKLQLEQFQNLNQSTNRQLNQLKTESEILRAELEREREINSENQKTISNSTREIQDFKIKNQNNTIDLTTQIQQLQKDLKIAQELIKTNQIETNQIQTNLKSSQDREIELNSKLQDLQSKSSSIHANEDSLTLLELKNNQDWNLLIDNFAGLGLQLENDFQSKLSKLLSRLSSPTARSSIVNRAEFVKELTDSLSEYIAITINRIHDEQNTARSLRKDLQDSNTLHEQEKSHLENQLEKLQTSRSNIEENQNLNLNELKTVKEELELTKQRLAQTEHLDKTFREIWKSLPTNMEARSSLTLESDSSAFISAYEQLRKPINAGGLGGLFGLAKRSISPPPLTDEPEFSLDVLLERMKVLIDNDKKLVEKLLKYETEKEQHKNNAIRAQKLVAESQEALRVYQSQVKALEEQLESADNQAAAMLERVNVLMESEEKAVMIAKKSENLITNLQQQIQTLEAELARLKEDYKKFENQSDKSKGKLTVGDLNEERRLKEELNKMTERAEDLMDELEEFRTREVKNRGEFLKQLSESREECNSLRSKVRQLERSQKAS